MVLEAQKIVMNLGCEISSISACRHRYESPPDGKEVCVRKGEVQFFWGGIAQLV